MSSLKWVVHRRYGLEITVNNLFGGLRKEMCFQDGGDDVYSQCKEMMKSDWLKIIMFLFS